MCQDTKRQNYCVGHRGLRRSSPAPSLSIQQQRRSPLSCNVNRICASGQRVDQIHRLPVQRFVTETVRAPHSSRTVGNASTEGDSGVASLNHGFTLDCSSAQRYSAADPASTFRNPPQPDRSPKNLPLPWGITSTLLPSANRIVSAERLLHIGREAGLLRLPSGICSVDPATASGQRRLHAPAPSADPPAASARRDPPAPSPAVSRPSLHSPAAVATPSPSAPAPKAKRPT